VRDIPSSVSRDPSMIMIPTDRPVRSVERKRLTICLRIPPLSSTRGGLGGAGAADDGRTAAPSLERHGAAGDQPAPAGGRSAPALVAGARALLGPRVGAPGALAQNR